MASRWITLTEHILKEERKIPSATGRLTLILNQIAEASKIIASHVKKSGLVDIQGKTGHVNIYQEEVQKLDTFSNDLLTDLLTELGYINMIASEEIEKPIILNNKGEYSIFFDPLDGSSNIDTNINIGTIFSIYKNADNKLQKGRNQVASGYVIYGSSVMFIYTCNELVNGFTLDPSIGSFLLSHPDIKVPETTDQYSINEGNFDFYDDKLKNYLSDLKKIPYRLRWVASMVADIHRILIKGGIFMYPSDKNSPDGKLRLMFEVNPLSLIVERAGGKSYSKKGSPLDISPSDLHQRVPIIMGSRSEVEKYIKLQDN
ncbi:fructose-bisphosphatase [Candidatus Roizmanbacteria bacterium RIFCSPHIGHO2_12_FULL_33_9]|uniref:Fructose-1,6-bisphosphatase class 1 n=1 Tax=Candidatus Roizmanbacteria bacterium RIFCSPHIGHO2_12_FULL_33_9 TaxID=1802045 RepID=A0A1F7HJ39_9BACT|nr:MAG: fructose-bisphosphatase [Candidatus Roizmanbacteria bacterium RIFCSPHIGHO2_12_FULL_33_9]